MKKVLIILLFIFLVNFISALNITIDYPEEVYINEEFEVNLELLDFPDDIYDVKIDILCEEVRISRIFDGKWKSTNYYINDIIGNGEEKKFDLKIEKECEEAGITIKIKNSKNKSEVFTGYKIKSVKDEEENAEIDEEDEEEDDDDKKEQEEENENRIVDSIDDKMIKLNNEIYKNQTQIEEKFETIELNPATSQNIKSEDYKKSLSKENYAKYGLGLFCVFLCSLFAIKKIRIRKNEFR